MSFQGHIENGMVVLEQPVPLPDGTPVVVEPLGALPADFWESCSLDELAKRQGVSPPRRIEDLLGGWPADERDDDFEQVFRSWREGEGENRR
jgi:hypothetical protein